MTQADREWLDLAGRRIDQLYRELSTVDLRDLRAALRLDLERGGDPDFIRNRLTALDRVLAERIDLHNQQRQDPAGQAGRRQLDARRDTSRRQDETEQRQDQQD